MLSTLFRATTRSFSTENNPLKLARILAMQHHQASALSFDPVTAPDSEILAYASLYGLERESLALQDRLVRFGRKALRQIKENRLPENSRFRNSLPADLAEAASPSDAAIIRWFADLVVDSASIFETPALVEFHKVKFETDARRQRLIKWLSTPSGPSTTPPSPKKLEDLAKLTLEELLNERQSIEDERKRQAIIHHLLAENLCDEATITTQGTTLASVRTLRNKLRGDKAAVGLRRANLTKYLTEANASFASDASLEQLENIYAPIKAAKDEAVAREKLYRWFFNSGKSRAGLESIDYQNPSTPVSQLESVKHDWLIKDKAARVEAAKTKLVEQARKFAAKMQEKGKLAEFDYRETNDDQVVAWFVEVKKKKKIF